MAAATVAGMERSAVPPFAADFGNLSKWQCSCKNESRPKGAREAEHDA